MGTDMETSASLDKKKSTPIYQQLAELIKAQIKNGYLEEGEMIPSEHQLAKRHDISRMTARRAIDVLVSEGFVVRQPGKGTFVKEDKVPMPPYSRFSFSRQLHSTGHSITTKVLTREILVPTPHISNLLRLDPSDHIIYIKRLRYVDQIPTVVHETSLCQDGFESLLTAPLEVRSMTDLIEEIAGERIVNSKDAIEALAADKNTADLLSIEAGSPLLVLNGLGLFSDERPIRVTSSIFRGDRLRFTLGENMELIPQVVKANVISQIEGS